MNLNENLISLRKSKNLSQEEIADRLGVSRQAISKWENGQAMPETTNVLKLCEILEVTPNELFGYEENQAQPMAQTVYNEEIKEEKKKWYKSTPFKVFVAVVCALIAVRLIMLVASLVLAGVFMQRSDATVIEGETVVIGSAETDESIATGGVVKFSTQGTNGYKVILRTEFVPDVYSSVYNCSFYFSGDGMRTVTAQAEFEGGMWVATVELEKTYGEIDVVFVTDTGYKKVPVKIATITGLDESSVGWK